jgi:hypothetical protein
VRVTSEEAESNDLNQSPNPVIYQLLVAPYRGYRILPKSLRHQLNLALKKLREQRNIP